MLIIETDPPEPGVCTAFATEQLIEWRGTPAGTGRNNGPGYQDEMAFEKAMCPDVQFELIQLGQLPFNTNIECYIRKLRYDWPAKASSTQTRKYERRLCHGSASTTANAQDGQ